MILWFVVVPALIAFVGFPIALTLWGRRLPSAHTTTREVVVPAARERVFALLVDVRAIPRWRKTIRRVELLATEPRIRYREHGAQGALDLEMLEVTPLSKIVIHSTPTRRMAFEGTWTYTLENEGEVTRVRLREEGKVPSPVARVFAAYVLGHATHVERTLAALAGRFRR